MSEEIIRCLTEKKTQMGFVSCFLKKSERRKSLTTKLKMFFLFSNAMDTPRLILILLQAEENISNLVKKPNGM